MPEFELSPQSAFSTAPASYGNIKIEEVINRAIVAVATPKEREAALNAACLSAYGAELPKTGKFTASTAADTLLLGMAQDQMFMLFDEPDGDPAAHIRVALDDTGYITDQSDSWAILRIQGPDVRSALERICPLNLHPANFVPNSVARTVMEHLAVIILSEAEDSFVLLSPRSTADSFLNVVETSAKNVS